MGKAWWQQSLNGRQRAMLVIGWTSFLYLGYVLTNRYPQFTPTYLPLFEFEQAIPFLPWTVIPYFILIVGMYLPILIRTPELFWKAMLALSITVVINYSIFFFYPTAFARPPLPEGGGIDVLLYRWLVGMDTPMNCFPSGHVAVPAVGCWYLIKENPDRRLWLVTVFALLIITVLTTKQHYFIDIIGGLVTATIGIVAAFYIYRGKPRVVGAQP